MLFNLSHQHWLLEVYCLSMRTASFYRYACNNVLQTRLDSSHCRLACCLPNVQVDWRVHRMYYFALPSQTLEWCSLDQGFSTFSGWALPKLPDAYLSSFLNPRPPGRVSAPHRLRTTALDDGFSNGSTLVWVNPLEAGVSDPKSQQIRISVNDQLLEPAAAMEKGYAMKMFGSVVHVMIPL
ncbi:hypothetical protein N1851_024414 [Merluccius polli]|uniref:Uncharacterized protein n=1 Tax=Merluccius polli TaxID=89951 RepID=A0AA47MFA6_MERPO|nr:hypothetical protein N1851_024414 [Merluccius polli]